MVLGYIEQDKGPSRSKVSLQDGTEGQGLLTYGGDDGERRGREISSRFVYEPITCRAYDLITTNYLYLPLSYNRSSTQSHQRAKPRKERSAAAPLGQRSCRRNHYESESEPTVTVTSVIDGQSADNQLHCRTPYHGNY